jgi:hypothetical protein
MSQKASDYSCVPLTMAEHREHHQIGKREFERRHGIHFAAVFLGAKYGIVLAGITPKPRRSIATDSGSCTARILAPLPKTVIWASSPLGFRSFSIYQFYADTAPDHRRRSLDELGSSSFFFFTLQAHQHTPELIHLPMRLKSADG